MPYIRISDVRLGIDRRRSRISGVPGSLWELVNAHITSGGEIERAKAFPAVYALPEGTFGLGGVGGILYVFGSGADPGVPSPVVYQRLQHVGGPSVDMVAVHWVEPFDGLLYVIAEFEDGEIYHYYDGARVTDWDDIATGEGKCVRTVNTRMYATSGSTVRWCDINDPTNWTTEAAGFLNIANQTEGAEDLTSISNYQGRLAIFSRNQTRIFTEDSSGSTFTILANETVQNVGTFAPRSVLPYGNLDVFFLADSGVRSLRPRDLEGTATAEDVGTAIDPLVLEHLETLTDAQKEAAVAAFHPTSGRFWLALGERVYVYSFFPGNKIQAWSYYKPGFATEAIVKLGSQLYMRDQIAIYAYGGLTGLQLPEDDELIAEVEFPFLDADDPATRKNFEGFDVSLEGEWGVKLRVDPRKRQRGD